ncbi:macrolide transporter subunit MacA [compost metagenome]
MHLEKGSLENNVEQQKLVVEQTMLTFDLFREENIGDMDRIRLKAMDVKKEELKLKELERQLNNAVLASKTAGVVTFVDTLKSGDPVTAFQTLVTVSDLSQMQLIYETSSPETLTEVQLGMEVNIKVGSQNLKGKVVQTPLSAPESGKNGTSDRFGKMLVIQPDETPKDIEIGNTADIQIIIEKRDQAIIIPRAGLRTFMGRDFVQVLEGESRKEIDVEKGIVTATEVEIKAGLSEGQQVILNN